MTDEVQEPDVIADEAIEAGERYPALEVPGEWVSAFNGTDAWLRRQSLASLEALADAAERALQAADPTMPLAVSARAREVLLEAAVEEIRRLL